MHRERNTAIAPEALTGSTAQHRGELAPRCAQAHPGAPRVRAGRKVMRPRRRRPRGMRPQAPPAPGAAPDAMPYDAPASPYGGGSSADYSPPPPPAYGGEPPGVPPMS